MIPQLKQEDVRIGNIISRKGKPTRVQLYILDEIRHFSTDCQPIEISEEWLKKAGFEKWENCNEDEDLAYFNGKVEIEQYHFTNESKWFLVKFLFWQTEVEIKYLHQLQNLYHSLTNEELNIQL